MHIDMYMGMYRGIINYKLGRYIYYDFFFKKRMRGSGILWASYNDNTRENKYIYILYINFRRMSFGGFRKHCLNTIC